MHSITVSLLQFSLVDLVKVKGKVPEEHDVSKEMKLINSAFEKYGKAENRKEKPTARINKEASSRMINSALAPK